MSPPPAPPSIAGMTVGVEEGGFSRMVDFRVAKILRGKRGEFIEQEERSKIVIYVEVVSRCLSFNRRRLSETP